MESKDLIEFKDYEYALEVKHLSKRFSNKQVLSDTSFSVKR
ncbi:MAG: hypothetical protein ACP5KD_08635 [Fervidobacterium sp.]|jgi:ABC-type multidrug transport system ATPase subunit